MMNMGRTPLQAWKKRFALLLVASLCLVACGKNKALERIEESGIITVITRNNAHCYYRYRDQDMGFEYDLAKAFAKFLGVELKVKVAESWNGSLPLLNEGEGDLVAASMTITPSRLERVDFSKGYLPVQQMVITHKKNRDIKGMDDLGGKTICVRSGTSYEDRLRQVKRGGLDITIKVKEDVPTEELIEAVAEGKLEVTIADSNVALLNRRYYPDIRIAFPLHKLQALGWAVRPGEMALLDKINEFFGMIEGDGTFKDIYNRYYGDVERFDRLDIKKFQQRINSRLPRYEKTIKKAATQYGFDWRLIAALIYQESQFRPWAKSFSGVRGLMQLTLPTARDVGVKNRLDPNQSIMGGVRYLRKLYGLSEKASESDRLLMALAAYNVGKGHIEDAKTLALGMQLDPSKWSSLERTLPLLREPKYYKKSKYGYCRGTEPVRHVRQIVTYYDILKRDAIEYGG
jgi:membrane-bound lytic murein transglycosylase F